MKVAPTATGLRIQGHPKDQQIKWQQVFFPVHGTCKITYTAEARKAKEPFLNELKEELMALKAAASDGTIKLLEHIYPVHPPKRGGKRDSSKSMKKQVLNAIRHYHPDKQHTQDDPAGQDSKEKNSAHEEDKWVVMCEEITKHLNGVWDMEFNCH
jgi:hypothetical protein